MARSGNSTPRQPATKFPHLKKKLAQNQPRSKPSKATGMPGRTGSGKGRSGGR